MIDQKTLRHFMGGGAAAGGGDVHQATLAHFTGGDAAGMAGNGGCSGGCGCGGACGNKAHGVSRKGGVDRKVHTATEDGRVAEQLGLHSGNRSEKIVADDDWEPTELDLWQWFVPEIVPCEDQPGDDELCDNACTDDGFDAGYSLGRSNGDVNTPGFPSNMTKGCIQLDCECISFDNPDDQFEGCILDPISGTWDCPQINRDRRYGD